MVQIWIMAAAILVSFLLGYGLHRFMIKWVKKANTAEAEAVLKAEQMRATVTASLDGIIIINSSGEVIEFSESAERIFGYRKHDILGQNMAQLIVPQRYREAHNAGMERMRQTGKAHILGQRIEIEAMRADGEEFMSELAISRCRSSVGDIFIAYIRDISDAKAAEKALLDAKEAAELANSAKTQFISAMSHEIRTPFNAVLGIFDILGESQLTDDQKDLITTAERTSRSLLRIINDVLDYARISSGSVEILEETFYAPDIFNDVNSLFAPQAKERNIALIPNIKSSEKIHLLGDLGRIQQILMNFVSNAIKYSQDGHVEMIVETRSNQHNANSADGANSDWTLICKVKDDGRGIAADKLEHIFDEFYMADEVDTRAEEGTGLGLTICAVLVNMMNGNIGVDSELGKGSTFWIEIPAKAANNIQNTVQNDTEEANIENVNILLAEDNATNRMVVTRILEKRGARITSANNGLEALEILKTQNFDLLLTDIFMPEMGGIDLIKTIRKAEAKDADFNNRAVKDSAIKHKTMPIIALTAMGDKHEAEQLYQYGVDDIVLKPFAANALINAIAVQSRHGNQKNRQIHNNEAAQKPITGIGETLSGETLSDKISSGAALDLRPYMAKGGLIDELRKEDLLVIKDQFKDDLYKMIIMLREALETENVENAKFASHSIKGLAGIYGFEKLSEAAQQTNQSCIKSNLKLMLECGEGAIEIAELSLNNLDSLFDLDERAA